MSGEHSDPDEYRRLMGVAVAAAREAGDALLPRFGPQILTEPKGRDSVVTALDLEMEQLIVERLHTAHPAHTIIGEELTPHASASEYSWVVDPIDGTRNFAAGIPLWAVSIGALEGTEPVAAAIYIPVTGEMFEAAKGLGARLNGRELRVSPCTQLSRGIVLTDLLSANSARRLPPQVLGGLLSAALRTRMLGSVCCALAYTAAGRADLYYRPSANVWDAAAGVLLVREAGGTVLSLNGERWDSRSHSIVAGNSALAVQLVAAVKRLETDVPTRQG